MRKRPPCACAAAGSDHCPAMKGIKTRFLSCAFLGVLPRSDHCPAMKGIKTRIDPGGDQRRRDVKRPLPRNEGD